eukprot:4214698-Alexandrium_andersonii.AAC.1
MAYRGAAVPWQRGGYQHWSLPPHAVPPPWAGPRLTPGPWAYYDTYDGYSGQASYPEAEREEAGAKHVPKRRQRQR